MTDDGKNGGTADDKVDDNDASIITAKKSIYACSS